MKQLQLQLICSVLVSCWQGARTFLRLQHYFRICSHTCFAFVRCLDLLQRPFKCNHELMVKDTRCCLFAFAKGVDSPASLGCRCPLDGRYPATLVKNGSKDNDLLLKPRAEGASARGVDYQTINLNDAFWDQWARRKGCGLQVVNSHACSSYPLLFLFHRMTPLILLCSRCLP